MPLLQTVQEMTRALVHGNLDDGKHSDKTKRHLAHQKNVGVRMCVTMTLVPLVLWLCYNYLPIQEPRLPTVIDRLTYTLKWQWPSVMLIAVMVQTVSLKRFTTDALNPIEGTEQHTVLAHKNALTNTIEQYIMNLMALLMLSVYLHGDQMKIVPMLVVVFVISRLQYWAGYVDPNMGRSNKSVGFFMSCYGTFVILLYCGYRFFKECVM